MSDNNTVWVVDDERSIRWVMERALTQDGLEVECFDDGESMLRTLEQRAPSAIVSDIRMPGVSGLDLLATVTAEFPDKQVYMVTAYDDGQLEATALESGARGYLTKPIDFNSLKGEVFGLETA